MKVLLRHDQKQQRAVVIREKKVRSERQSRRAGVVPKFCCVFCHQPADMYDMPLAFDGPWPVTSERGTEARAGKPRSGHVSALRPVTSSDLGRFDRPRPSGLLLVSEKQQFTPDPASCFAVFFPMATRRRYGLLDLPAEVLIIVASLCDKEAKGSLRQATRALRVGESTDIHTCVRSL